MSADIPAADAGAVVGAEAVAAGRGRPRSAEADRAILAATLDLLGSRGLAAMSIEEVAARAGVGKATIYRRWPSKGQLALDAFVQSFQAQQPLPDTGTLRGDLIAALTAWVRAVTQTSMGSMLTGLIAEAQHDPALRAAWRERVLEPLRTQHRVMLDWAIARGEIPATTDQEAVLDLFFGAAQHRLLLGHLPLNDDFIRSVVDIILNGILLRLVGRCGTGRHAGVMIARIWRGWAPVATADDYQRHYETEVSENLRSVPGFCGARLLRRAAGGAVEFTSITFFTSLDAVRGFAGDDFEVAVVEEAARRALSRWDERVTHHEVVVSA